MRFEDEAATEALARLRRIEGQVGGIARMIEDGRECREVIQQISAAGRALDRVGLGLLTSQLRRCLAEEPSRDVLDAEAEVQRLFMSLR